MSIGHSMGFHLNNWKIKRFYTDYYFLVYCPQYSLSRYVCWSTHGLERVSCHVFFLFILYNKLGGGRNCQTHRSYAIFPVESNNVISFRATRIFK